MSLISIFIAGWRRVDKVQSNIIIENVIFHSANKILNELVAISHLT